MRGRRVETQPGYPAYLPASYQFLGPEQDQLLDQIIAINAGANVSPSGPALFWVKTPNVRCRTRVSLVLEPDDVDVNPNTTSTAGFISTGGTLWVAEHERTRAGNPQVSPVRNVIGTSVAPQAIPTDPRLWGFVFEVETNGQELYGRFLPSPIPSEPLSATKWHLIVRYESVERLSDEEWSQFQGRYGCRVSPEGGLVVA